MGILVVLFWIIVVLGAYFRGYDQGQKKERKKNQQYIDVLTRMETHIELAPDSLRPQLEQQYFDELRTLVREKRNP